MSEPHGASRMGSPHCEDHLEKQNGVSCLTGGEEAARGPELPELVPCLIKVESLTAVGGAAGVG